MADQTNVMEIYTDPDLTKYTVKDLQAVLKKFRIPSSSKKEEIIERIERHRAPRPISQSIFNLRSCLSVTPSIDISKTTARVGESVADATTTFPGMGSRRITILYNGEKLEYEKQIGKGTWGSLHIYGNEIHRVAIKFTQDTAEYHYVATITKDKINCSVVPAKIIALIKDSTYYSKFIPSYEKKNPIIVIALVLMAGDLSSIMGEITLMSPLIKRHIVLTILQMIICLRKHMLSYIDIKSANFLYKCSEGNSTEGGSMTLALGDIGSITEFDESAQAATYPPPGLEGWKGEQSQNEFTYNTDESAMTWGLIIFWFSLYDQPATYRFAFSQKFTIDSVMPLASRINGGKEALELYRKKLEEKDDNVLGPFRDLLQDLSEERKGLELEDLDESVSEKAQLEDELNPLVLASLRNVKNSSWGLIKNVMDALQAMTVEELKALSKDHSKIDELVRSFAPKHAPAFADLPLLEPPTSFGSAREANIPEEDPFAGMPPLERGTPKQPEEDPFAGMPPLERPTPPRGELYVSP